MKFWLNREPELPLRRYQSFLLWLMPFSVFVGICVLLGALISDEMRTSAVQAKWLSWYGQHITFAMEPDANPDQRYPKFGPYNERLGYRRYAFFH